MIEIEQDPKAGWLARSTTHWLYFNGMMLCLKEWASVVGIKHKTLDARINQLQWGVEKALTTPVQKRRYREDA